MVEQWCGHLVGDHTADGCARGGCQCARGEDDLPGLVCLGVGLRQPLSAASLLGHTNPASVLSAARGLVEGVYPAQIGVSCDRCGHEVVRDYVVSDACDQAIRFGYARAYLSARAGWLCTSAGDLCPDCVRTASPRTLVGCSECGRGFPLGDLGACPWSLECRRADAQRCAECHARHVVAAGHG